MPLAPSPSLSLLLPLATSVFFVSLSKCLLWLGFFQPYLFHPLPSKSSNLQNLLLSLHKGRYVLLCVMLVSPSRSCSGSLQTALLQHSPHVPPVLLQTAIMCLSAAQHGDEWGLFSIPPAIYLTPQLVTGGEETQSPELRFLRWEEGLAAR